MAWLLAVLQQHLSETTAHGVSRLVGDRTVALRVFWTVCFLALCVVCSLSLRDAMLRLQKKDQKTSFLAEKVKFEFPDLFVCGMSPMSASFSMSINESQRNSTLSAMAAAEAKVPRNGSINRLKIIVNSLPYQMLADDFGHRVNQMVLRNEFLGAGTKQPNGHNRVRRNTQEFYHPESLRCARFSFNDTERQILRQGGNGILLFMLADAFFPEFPISNHSVHWLENTLQVYPIQWNLADGFNAFGNTGLRMYLVEPGTYPADWSASVLLNPGTMTDLRISMVQTDYNEVDFPDKCVPSSQTQQPVHFDNPYSPDEPYAFKYSYAYCYYRELSQRTQQLLNCTPWRHPKPAQFAQLRSCDNVTGMTSEAFQLQSTRQRMLQQNYSEIVTAASVHCSSRHPCSSKSYSVRATAVDWPPAAGIANFVSMAYHLLETDLQQPQPVMNFLVHYSFNANYMHREPNQVRRLARTQTIQVRLFAEAEYSTQVVTSLDYTVKNFFAEAGGFLGLYLGCSVLTLGELVELLHNVVVAVACGREKCCRGGGAKVASDAANDKEAGGGEAAVEVTDA